ILATGPCTESSTCWSGCSHGMPVPAAWARLAIVTARPIAVPMRKVKRRLGIRSTDISVSMRFGVRHDVEDGVATVGIDAGDTHDRLDAAGEAAARDEHDHVDRFGDEAARHGDDGLLDQLLEPIERGC